MDVFVFGSNLAGRHGKGAALYARQHHGAVYGQGVGLQGRSYAIPTKDQRIRTLPLDIIQQHVRDFVIFACKHPEMTFQVTRIGCGLAGYRDEDIAPMFSQAPVNCVLPEEWKALIFRPINPSFNEALKETNDSLRRFKEFLAKPIS